MKLDIQVPTVDKENKITAKIICGDLNRSGEIEIQYDDLACFSSNSVAVDLFLVASFVYGIDRFIDRYAYSEDGWSRTLEVKVPVNDPIRWKDQTEQLENILSFLTGDYWSLTFYKSDLQVPLKAIPTEWDFQYAQVNLFSGGLDSLIGAIDFLAAHPSRKLLVVSHFDPHISARQEQNLLKEELKAKYPDNFYSIPSVSVSLSRSELEKEKTFRSRSLLFISIAALVSSHQSLPIIVPENGTVSLNFPLSSSRRSACSTRTTHPTFIQGLRDLLADLGLNGAIENPYELQTKGEMVRDSQDSQFLKLLVATSNSCGKRGHRANWTFRNRDHCGVCMPCVYRQAALQNILDSTEYGNSINKNLTGRHSQTPFLKSKQGQDFNACLDFLRRDITDQEIRTELLVNGAKDFSKLDLYVDLIKRSRNELKAWITKVGSSSVKNKAGIQ